MFFRNFKEENKRYSYLYNPDNIISDITNNTEKNIFCPLVLDTEFYGKRRKGLTVQIKSIFNSKGVIFAHTDLKNYCDENNLKPRHKVLKHDFSAIDYINELGFNCHLIKTKRKKQLLGDTKTGIREGKLLPIIHFDIYSHFALAELFMIFSNDFKQEILKLVKGKTKFIEMKRRLRTVTKHKGIEVSDFVEINNFLLKLEGKEYRIKIRIIDTNALHGNSSYKNLCQSLNIELKYKDNFTNEQKSNMLEMYFSKPSDFDNYALGDLEVYNILVENDKLFRKLYNILGINEYYKTPKLTIGSTISNLYQSVLFNHFNIDFDDKITQEKLLSLKHFSTANYLKNQTNNTSCLLAKVHGGRCRNNRPTNINSVNSTIIDIDINSAYGNGLRIQKDTIGKPIIESYEVDKHTNKAKSKNKFLTLRQWLKLRKYGTKNNELIYGLWCAIVSTKELSNDEYMSLQYKQDILTSWFNFSYEEISNLKTDTENFESELLPKTGINKIFNNQVINSVITSDFLDFLDNVCNKKQRDELLDNLYIQTAIYYPSYSEIKDINELFNVWEKWENKNISKSQKEGNNTTITKTIKEPNQWLRIDLDKMLIDTLIAYRKLYPKKDNEGNDIVENIPLNNLFKLCINTLYGVFCSPYFNVSNVIVGNNITARCRMLAWYMEKGFNLFQTITDGGTFDFNKVVFPVNNRRLYNHQLINLYQEKDSHTNRKITFKPLYQTEEIKLKELDQLAMLHLKNLFPNVYILHGDSTQLKVLGLDQNNKPIIEYVNQKGLFNFETKDIYKQGVFHGTSNYLLIKENGDKIIKMRSYEKSKHETIELINDELELTNFYDELTPSLYFLSQLFNPKQVKRSKVFRKLGILKLNEFKNNFDKWVNNGFLCGDTIEKLGLLRELSLSQFTYQNKNQYLSIEKELNRNKRKYFQSFEGYFLNDDKSLNYQLMIETMDNLINVLGVNSINEYFDKNYNRHRNKSINHEEKETLILAKETMVNNIEGDITVNITNDEIDIDFNSDFETFEGDIEF